jgi:hypothetical protein
MGSGSDNFTRFECSFQFTRFECSFQFTRSECSFIFARFECVLSRVLPSHGPNYGATCFDTTYNKVWGGPIAGQVKRRGAVDENGTGYAGNYTQNE